MNKRETIKLVEKYESLWYNQDSPLKRIFTASARIPVGEDPMDVMSKTIRLIIRNITSENNRAYKYHKCRDGFGTLDIRYIFKWYACIDDEFGGPIKICTYQFRFEDEVVSRMTLMFIINSNGVATMTEYIHKDDMNIPPDYTITEDDGIYWMRAIDSSVYRFMNTLGFKLDKAIIYGEKRKRKTKKNTESDES